MKKKGYTLNFGSYYLHSEKVVYDILACDTLQKIFFPVEIIRPEPFENLRIDSEKELIDANLLDEFSHATMSCMSMVGKHRIYMSTTISHETNLGHSTVVIKFSGDFIFSNEFNYGLIESLCSEIIPIFRPFYASAFDASRPTRSTLSGGSMFYEDETSQRSYPLEVRWVGYFGLEMLEFLKVERFQNLKTYFKKYQLDQGILLLLQEEVFQHTNEAHLQRQEQAEQELGFPELLADQ